jgi:hypothetical protein
MKLKNYGWVYWILSLFVINPEASGGQIILAALLQFAFFYFMVEPRRPDGNSDGVCKKCLQARPE